MKAIATATALVLATTLSAPAIADEAPSKGEVKLAKLIEGRIAGDPRGCISVLRGNDLDIIDKTAIVYESGDTVWVARPSDPRSLDDRDVLIVERTGSQLCKHDIRQTVDSSTGMLSSIVFLSDFVPYRRAES